MLKHLSSDVKRRRVHTRIRKRVQGHGSAPRLNVYRSARHIYAQVVDDVAGHTLVSASSLDKEVRGTLKTGGNVPAAKDVGRILAERATKAGVSRVVFDRGGYAYHGRVRALAEAARSAGLKF